MMWTAKEREAYAHASPYLYFAIALCLSFGLIISLPSLKLLVTLGKSVLYALQVVPSVVIFSGGGNAMYECHVNINYCICIYKAGVKYGRSNWFSFEHLERNCDFKIKKQFWGDNRSYGHFQGWIFSFIEIILIL